MPRLLVLLFLAGLALAIIALIDCISTDEYEIRGLPKIVWVFRNLLLLVPADRPDRVVPRRTPATTRRRRGLVLAPGRQRDQHHPAADRTGRRSGVPARPR